jgi:hypothetical protein
MMKLRMRHKGRHAQDGRHGGHQHTTTPAPADTADTAESAAMQEARKGTAAEHPAIQVTPEGEARSGALVEGEFVESREGPFSGHNRSPEHERHDVETGELPGENERTKDAWWAGGGGAGGEEK